MTRRWTVEPCYVRNAERVSRPRGKPRFAVVTPGGRDYTYKMTAEGALRTAAYFNRAFGLEASR